MAQSGAEFLAVLKVSYDYEPQSEDEIAIKENQTVFLLERTDDDWWKVKIKGDSQDEDSPSGLVPSAYVEQAEHTSFAKALYDYDAAAPGELSIREDEILVVFDREGEWTLVQSRNEGGKAGFVPGNYIEESSGAETLKAEPEPELELEPEPEPAPPSERRLAPSSHTHPARPASVYVDPADRVAQTPVKAQTDHIKTWAVSEVDKKGKKKKGTLGIGNGSLFFASESDKTPVQKWDTADVEDFTIERHKHVLIDMGGRNPTKLHFNVGKEEIAETILTKLDDSRRIAKSSAKVAVEAVNGESHARPSVLTPPPRAAESSSPSKKNGVSVRFTEESPEIIPPREPSEEGDAEDDGQEEGGELAAALYDFESTGPDELSVQEGEQLYIIEKEGEEWWKCRNVRGNEGVVPASYLESLGSSAPTKPKDIDDPARREREREEAEKNERESRELADKERKKAEQERAKAAAEAQIKHAATSATVKKPRQEAIKHSQQKAESELHSRSSASNSSRDSSARTTSESKNTPSPESTRIWHDRSGQFRVEAALLGYTNGKLRLHKVNGVVIEVPSEKMSVEDMQYVERLMKRKPASPLGTGSRGSNDDGPLAPRRRSDATKRESKKKGSQIDWFEFFLSAGCDVDDCTRYEHSFEKDKIDESLLPDITESTMRSLGLREGDIIRVNKAIQQKYAKPQALTPDHLASDEELAIRLQEEENAKKPDSRAPNLFAGPGGILKNNTQRRGRPQPSKTLPPSAVDLGAIGSASEQIKRSGSPLVRTSSPAAASVQPPQRSSSAMATVSGFDDDAWTNRPGSKPPLPNPTPPAIVPPRATSVPPAPQVAAAPSVPSVPAQGGTATSSSSLAKTTDTNIFDQLARLSELKTNRAIPSLPTTTPTSTPPVSAPPVVSPPPAYNNGLGVGPSPTPVGQHLQNQQSGVPTAPQQNGPRGPYAPVPANQGLLQPLVPTQTGFGGFVATHPPNVSPFQPQPQPAQTSFLQPQVTGFPASGPVLTQPTGVGGGPFGGFTSASAFPGTTLTPVQPNPTGFSPFGQSPFNNVVSTPFSAPPTSSSNSNTSPANIFAQMKSGTFASGNDHAAPQQAGKYDALRANPQPTGWVAQPTGWGVQPNAGFHSGYTGY